MSSGSSRAGTQHKLRATCAWAILGTIALGGCGSGKSPDVAAAKTATIHADADWIRDGDGRVVLLRGANYSGLEFGNFVGDTNGPREADFIQMASWGVNAIRLPIAWAFLEPKPNQFDDSYLVQQVDPVVGWAAAHGIGVVLDMHQYDWSGCVGGLGEPTWICDGHDYPQGPAGIAEATRDFFALADDPTQTPAVASDGRLLRDHFLDAWRLVTRHYASDTRIIGWDYFNEPLSVFLTLSCHSFELEALHPLYRKMRTIAVAENAERTWFYEPPVTRNGGNPPTLEAFGPNVVYAPHLYALGIGLNDPPYDGDKKLLKSNYDQAMAEAAQLGGPLVVGEFGGTADGPSSFLAATALFLHDTYDELDQRLSGGFFWAYFPGDNGFSVVKPGGVEKGNLVDALARPYAQRVAGIPTAMSFDSNTKEFRLAFNTDDARQPADPTEIFLPARVYPKGFTVETTPGDRWEMDASGLVLRVFRGDAVKHEVRVVANGGGK